MPRSLSRPTVTIFFSFLYLFIKKKQIYIHIYMPTYTWRNVLTNECPISVFLNWSAYTDYKIIIDWSKYEKKGKNVSSSHNEILFFWIFRREFIYNNEYNKCRKNVTKKNSGGISWSLIFNANFFLASNDDEKLI